MKKISNFLVRFRIPVFLAMIAFTALCAFLMPHVNINKDMTKYLSESSPMKQGLDLMDKEFPDNEDEYYIRLLLTDVPADKKLEIKNKIKDMEYVDSVSYKLDDEDYNKDNYTLYEVNTLFDYGTPEVTAIEKELGERYKEYKPVVENLSNDVALAPYLYISVSIVLLVIMFLMSGSWFEPVLVLSVIGISILVNMGSNFFLPSVSNTTFAIAAILQLVLSLDYSVILMNRYRQERKGTDDKVRAMKTALASAFPSIVSSALTTFVGLLMLVFMNYRIGADLGVVLAKGVAVSLLCIFTMLPFLILISDKILAKTKKPSLNIPMGGLAKFSNKLKYALPAIFAGIFILFFFLQRLTPISFDGTPDRQIAKIFPETNRIVVLYNNKDSANVPDLQEKIEELEGVTSTASFESTLDKKRTPEGMIDFLEDMDADVDMEPEDLKLIYYDRFKNGEAPSVKVADLMMFINDELLPRERYAKEMDEETKENIPTMVKFADRKALVKTRTYAEMTDFLRESGNGDEEMKAEDMRLMYVYYFAETPGYEPGTMTIDEFVRFVREDVAADQTIAEYNDEADYSQIDQMADYTDAVFITAPRSASDMAGVLSMDADQADMLYSLYFGLPAAGSYTMTINELLDYLVNDASANPLFADRFDSATLTQLTQAQELAGIAASGQALTSEQMAAALGMEATQTAGIYMMYGMTTGNTSGNVTMTLPEFLSFLENVMSNPQSAASGTSSGSLLNMDPSYAAALTSSAAYGMQPDASSAAALPGISASSIDPSAAAALNSSAGLINAAASGTQLDAAAAASLLDMDASSMSTLYALKAGADTPDRNIALIDMVDFLLSDIAPDAQFGAAFTDENVADMTRLSQIMHTALEGRQLTFADIAGILGQSDPSDMKMLFTLRDAKLNPDFGRMSVEEFITFLTERILPDAKMSEKITDQRRKDLNSLSLLVNAVMSDREYAPDELSELFLQLSDKADPDDLYLLTMLYGSFNDYDPEWKMNILEMFDFISEDVINDPRFASVLKEEDKQKVIDNRQDMTDAVNKLKGPEHSILLINSKLPYESAQTDAFMDKLYALLDESLPNDNYRIGNSAMYREMQGSFGGEMLLITILTAATIFAIVAITFRNLMIPLLLVAIVLCGVFITVAVSGLRGVSINYLANIIVQCILMGACIDYGILFTSYYRDNRKSKDIRDSLKAAYDGSIHTVLTSGLIMVVVTGIIGFISTDPAVAPICMTLSIGSASAILLILFVLPGMLAAFDKIVKGKKNSS